MASSTTHSLSSKLSPRYEFLDLLRGIAVLLMVEGHAMRALLHWNIRGTFAYDIHEMFHGLTAPMFIFASGAALAFTRRSGHREKPTEKFTSWRKKWRREIRLLSVLIIAYTLQLNEFSFFRTFFASTPEILITQLNFNVLQCIVVSIFLVRLVSSLPASEPQITRLLAGVAVLISLATPFVWAAAPALPMWVSTMLSHEYHSYFPIFPYSGFAFAGVAWCMLFRQARENNAEEQFLHWTVLACGALVVLCAGLAVLDWPEPDSWGSGPWYTWLLIAVIALLSAFLRRIEAASDGSPGAVQKLFALIGRESFYIYVGHLAILYGTAFNYRWNMLRLLGVNLGWSASIAATSCLIIAIIATAMLWDWAKRAQPVWSGRMKWGLAAYLAAVFVVS